MPPKNSSKRPKRSARGRGGSSQGGNQRSRASAQGRPRQVQDSKIQMMSYPAPVSRGLSVRYQSGLGMADLISHRFQYQAGFIYVGNGTRGTTGGVYFSTNDNATTVTPLVPILPADATLGQSYIADVAKHFARKVIHSVKLRVIPISTSNSTSTGIDVILAPFRSGAVVPVFKTDTTAANSAASVIGMSGARQFSVWLGCELDLSAYFAGGSGARQNEFNIASSVASSSETTTTDTLLSPCAFAVAGDAPPTTYDGTNVARVYVEIVMSFLDFIGGFAASNPGLASKTRSADLPHRVMKNSLEIPVASRESTSKQCAVLDDYVRLEEPLAAPSPAELRQLALTRQSAGGIAPAPTPAHKRSG